MTKKNLILAISLVVLIAIAYIYQGPFKSWSEKISKPDNFLTGINIEGVSKIELAKGDKNTVLEKDGDKWKIQGTKSFYVETNIMDGLISNFKEAAKADLEIVSENKEKKEDFLTNENGMRVKLFQGGDELINFVVGKLGSDYKSTYISADNLNETYLVGVNLNNSVNRGDWYDKTIFAGNKENINKIRFQYPNREFTIEKKDDAWEGVLPYEFEIDEDKIGEILGIVSSLEATEIPEQKFEGTGLEKHNIIVEVTGEGLNNVLMVGDKNEDGLYYVKKGDSDNIYLITENQRDELDKQIWQLK